MSATSHPRWRLRALLLSGLLLLGALIAAATSSASIRRPVAVTAAAAHTTACYSHAQASEALTGSDLAFLKKLIPCEAGSLDGTGAIIVSRTISDQATAVLERDRSLTQAQETKVDHAILYQESRAYCGGRPWRFADQLLDSVPPPVLTPALLASTLKSDAKMFPILKEAGTVFGFAYEKRQLFKNEPTTANPVAVAILAYHCF